MYSDHFGLAENPFTPLSSASRPYRSKELEEALSHFQYARLNRESFFLLVGEVGTGKSTAVRAIVEALGPEFPVAVVSHTRLDPRELLEEVLRNFGVDSEGVTSKSQMLGRLERYLSSASEGSPAVLIIDEAHLLSHAALEEVRLLSNLQEGDRSLLQICLVGQPELLERLRQHSLRPLRQRIAVRYVFGNLTRQETRDYLWHRLEAAGAVRPHAIFTADAADAVHAMTEGLPREINVVAGQAMLNAYIENAPAVRREHVRTTKHDYGFEGVRVARNEPGSAVPRVREEAPAEPPLRPPAPADAAPVPVARRAAPPEPPALPPKTPALPPKPKRPFEPAETQPITSTAKEPEDLVLQDDDLFLSEIQSSSRGTRMLVIATAVVAVGVLATIALMLYPKNLIGNMSFPEIGNMSFPEPPHPSSVRPVESPLPETVPASEPESALLEPSFSTPPTEAPVSEPLPEEAPAPQAPEARPVPLSPPVEPSTQPVPRPRPQPVSSAAVAADRLERGVWLAQNGSLDAAIVAFREALALDPGYIDALYNLGASLLEKGELGEAIDTLRRTTSISPNHGLAQRTLGIALRQSGSLLEAGASLSRAVELMPNDVFALRHLAGVLRESGDLDRAIDASRKAVALRPDDAGVQQELGFALRAAGRLPEATTALQRSVEIDGSLALARYTLGVTLLEMGNRDAGEREIAEARRLGYNPR